MSGPNIWYWLACIVFGLASSLLIHLIRRQDKKMEDLEVSMNDMKRELSGLQHSCVEKHKAIGESLKAGRERFRIIEDDIKEMIKGDKDA